VDQLDSRRGDCGSPGVFCGGFIREPWGLRPRRTRLYPSARVQKRLLELGGKAPNGLPYFKAGWGGEPRFIAHPERFLLLRWHPAESYGLPSEWYATRWEDGEAYWSYAEEYGEDYPWNGDYEVEGAFVRGQPFILAVAEEVIQRWKNRPERPSFETVRRAEEDRIQKEKERQFYEDWDRLNDATPAFAGVPMVGYGAKSGSPVPPPEKQLSSGMEKRIARMTEGRHARLERMDGAA
jgi:hypothetical protein